MSTQLFDQWLEAGRAVMGPALRWQEIAADTAQKMVQHNLAVSRDVLEFSDRQWQLLGEAKEPQKLFADGNKNAVEFSRKLVDRTTDLFRVARETQEALATWSDQAAKTAAENFTPKSA